MDEDYFVPLQDQRVFGAGIRRKRVPFVRSSEHELNTTTAATAPPPPPTSTTPGSNVANKYLSIVLPKNEQPRSDQGPAPAPASASGPESSAPVIQAKPKQTNCEICNLPLHSAEKLHEASLAHQLCLSHSHPPSHFDRTRHGLRYLSAYGWDPDSRLGLGMPGREGIREPVKGRLKADTVGLGVRLPGHGGDDDDEDEGSLRRRKDRERRERMKVQERGTRVEKRLNAKEVRKGDLEARKRGDKLKEMFYQSEDVQKYLGE